MVTNNRATNTCPTVGMLSATRSAARVYRRFLDYHNLLPADRMRCNLLLDIYNAHKPRAMLAEVLDNTAVEVDKTDSSENAENCCSVTCDSCSDVPKLQFSNEEDEEGYCESRDLSFPSKETVSMAPEVVKGKISATVKRLHHYTSREATV